MNLIPLWLFFYIVKIIQKQQVYLSLKVRFNEKEINLYLDLNKNAIFSLLILAVQLKNRFVMSNYALITLINTSWLGG